MSFFHNNHDASPKNVMESAETRAPDEKRPASKLNFFQRGIGQAVFSFALAFSCLLLGEMIFVWLYTSGFLGQGVIIFFFVFASSAVMVAIIFVVMKLTMRLNIASKVTLPKVVEFSYALQCLGVHRFDEQIDFIARKKIFVFVADAAILSPYKEYIRVKRYIFLSDKKKLKYFNGDKRLCLDAEDYERLLQEHGEHTTSAFSARIVELEQTVSSLKAAHSLQCSEIAKLTEENKGLQAENFGHRQKLQTVPGRQSRAEKRGNDKIPFWLVAAPLVNRLIAEAGPDTRYTRPQIQAAFLHDLEAFPKLKPAIRALLHTAKKEAAGTPYELEGWGMDAIRSALGDFVQKEGSAPKKANKDRVL